ncbi:MAG: CBS domain-containing protein [Chitinispirillales bacterium]|jgi:CBS domain-containing protein/anti-sigma regulatory factor (Ser/Thr protein kinase)|nr:CBS domain-containing protein [Chitinispirillales bacterium]
MTTKAASIVEPSRSSLMTLEIIFKLKVRDVMTAAEKLITASRADTLRHVQKLMQEYHISGVPIAEDGRLFGLVSVDNILRALDFGYIEDTVEGRMTRNLIVLDADMPLTFALSWFERYKFGRFPVLDKNEKLVGIVTAGDVMNKILFEMNKEVNKMETDSAPAPSAPVAAASGRYYREFAIKKFDFEKGGSASNEIRRVLKERSLNPKLIRRVAIASYELEINLVAHSDGGKLSCYIGDDKIEIIAKDTGPGIPDVDLAMEEGFSTATDWIRSLGFGAGLGLPNVKRASDSFDIRSQIGLGTIVKATVFLEEGAFKSVQENDALDRR